MNETVIFNAAIKLLPQQRASFIKAACAGNADLEQEVAALLHEHDAIGSFIDHPAIQPAVTESPRSPPEQPGALIGPYKLLEQIGEGGMGVVYVAEQTEPVRRRVALKIIKPGMDSKQVIARFEAERQALAMMDHPNIAKILDAGTVGKDEGGRRKDEGGNGNSSFSPHPSSFASAGRPYFVMELVRGIPITEFCEQKQLSAPDRLQLVIDVCHAVQHAHQKGIIHRDLKPSNILVTLHDGTPVVKVIDFGVAKAIGAQLTERTVYTAHLQLVGTPLYMSPEQAELSNLDVDTRADVYSLGVLLYELLTGTTPFDKERLKSATFDEMRRIIREEEPETVSARIARTRRIGVPPVQSTRHRGTHEAGRCAVPPSSLAPSPSPQPSRRSELDWIVMKALEKDRSRRYESASSLAADIQRFLSDEPVYAHPPTLMYRFQKFARKHRPALVTAAAVALCLFVGTTVSAWQAVRATTAEAQASANAAQAVANEQQANANAAQAQAKAQEATEQRDEAQKQRDEVQALAEQLRRTLYASHMNLAQNAWDAGTITRVRELLNQHRPKAGETDLRGFEWHYLNRLCRSELFTVRGGTAGWEDIVFSPDGKRFASTGSPSTVKIWDAQTGKEALVIKDLKVTVTSVAYSPDGKRIAGCAGWDYTAKKYVPGGVKIWDAETGKELLSIPGREVCYYDVAFSPDGKRIAAGGGDRGNKPSELSVWDAHSGEKLLTLSGEVNKSEIWSIDFSPDGKRLAAGFSSYDSPTIKVWDAQTGAEQLSLAPLSGGDFSVFFSPDGKRLAGTRQIWDVESGQVVLSLKKDSRTVSSSILGFSPGGKHIACFNAAVIEIRDAETLKLDLTLKGHTGPMYYAAFSPDGKKLVTRSGDRSIKVWDPTARQEARTVRDETRPLRTVSFSPDGRRVAYVLGRSDRTAVTTGGVEFKICDLPTGRELYRLKTLENVAGARVTFSLDGNRMLLTSQVDAKVLDGDSGRELLTIPGRLLTPTFSPDGKRLACQTSDGPVKVLDLQTGQELVTFKGHSHRINQLAYSPDGKRLATQSSDGTAKLFDAETGKEILTIKTRLSRERSGGLAFSPDGKRLAIASLASDYNASSGGIGEVKVVDSETGKELLSLKGHTAMIQSVVFSPNGKRLASGAPYEVKLWDAEKGHELLTLIGGYSGGSLAFGPGGNWLATDASGVIQIYDATPLPEKP